MDNKHYIIVLSLLFLMMTIKWEAVNGQRPFFSFQPGDEVPAEYLKEHGHDAFPFSPHSRLNLLFHRGEKLPTRMHDTKGIVTLSTLPAL